MASNDRDLGDVFQLLKSLLTEGNSFQIGAKCKQQRSSSNADPGGNEDTYDDNAEYDTEDNAAHNTEHSEYNSRIDKSNNMQEYSNRNRDSNGCDLSIRINTKQRYLQIAFNDDLSSALRIIRSLPRSDRVIVEVGTPLIKSAGVNAISAIANVWDGIILADLKTVDGACNEVNLVADRGAHAATVLGSAPKETVERFIETCQIRGLASFIDCIGVDDPLQVIRVLNRKPTGIVLHKGRDEEGTRGKVIQYRHVKRVLSKFDVMIAAAGGVDLQQSRSAIFNGAQIVVVNVVYPNEGLCGIKYDANVCSLAQEFLKTVQ